MINKEFVMYENILLFDRDIEKSTPSDSSDYQNSFEVDYDQIEKAMYNALKRLDIENKFQEASKSSYSDTDVVEFSSSTDARMLTGSVVDAPTSSAQQQTTYLLDIRNILLLFLFIYFLVTVYSKLKNLLINYYTND